MAGIYKPQGRAGEYSPYAFNYFSGCTHGCTYCYVPKMMAKFDKDYDHSDVHLQQVTRESIERDCAKHADLQSQVFVSFTSDPYMNGFDTSLTTSVLENFLQHRIPCAVLTKAPKNAVGDFSLMQKFGDSLILGTTITTMRDFKSVEPFADTPRQRINAMAKAKEFGLITWISMEPAFTIEQGLEIINQTAPFIDRYRLGKLNYRKLPTDWTTYVIENVELLRSFRKSIYVKKDLAAYAPVGFLTAEELDPRLQDAKPFGRSKSSSSHHSS